MICKVIKSACCLCTLISVLSTLLAISSILYIYFLLTFDNTVNNNLFTVYEVHAAQDASETRTRLKTQDQSVVQTSVGLYDAMLLEQTMHVINTSIDTGKTFETVMHCFWQTDRQRNESTIILVSNPIQTTMATLGTDKMIQMVTGFKRNTCFYDYSGNGYSSGIPSEKTIYKDIESVLKKLTETPRNDGFYIPTKKIVLYGHSLGAAVTIDLASKTRGIGGVVVVEPFVSVFSMPNLANRVLPGYVPQLTVNASMIKTRDPFRSDEKISQITDCPILVLRGKNDKDVPISHSQHLVESARNADNKKVLFTQVDADLDYTFNEASMDSVFKAIQGFLNENGL